MMSRVSRTSITSISGVVFISTITSPSPLSLPTFIAIWRYLYPVLRLLRFVSGLGQKADLLDASDLAGQDHAPDRFEANILVAANMDFGKRPAGCERMAQRILELTF